MASVNSSFKQYIKDITPIDYYYTNIFPSRLSDAETDLKKAFPAGKDMSYVAARYIGSARKKTMITPVDDLDIIVEFKLATLTDWSYGSDSRSFITRVRNAYDGIRTQVVGTRGQAVRVFYEKYGHVDVVPAVRVNDITYKIPDGKGGWMYTSPELATYWFFERHKTLHYRLKDLVKLLKKWNQLHSSRLKSFHIETMAASMFTDLSVYQDLNVIEFFGAAPNWLDVNDPGQQSGSLAASLDYQKRLDIIQSFKTAHAKASEARALEQQGKHEAAIAKWKWLFGSSFPD